MPEDNFAKESASMRIIRLSPRVANWRIPSWSKAAVVACAVALQACGGGLALSDLGLQLDEKPKIASAHAQNKTVLTGGIALGKVEYTNMNGSRDADAQVIREGMINEMRNRLLYTDDESIAKYVLTATIVVEKAERNRNNNGAIVGTYNLMDKKVRKSVWSDSVGTRFAQGNASSVFASILASALTTGVPYSNIAREENTTGSSIGNNIRSALTDLSRNADRIAAMKEGN